MFGPKDYILVCHGCGKFHVVRSEFLSVPMSYRFDIPGDSGRFWTIPAHGCPECASEPSVIGPDNRYVGRLRDGYLFGMSPESRERANREFLEWLPRLEKGRG